MYHPKKTRAFISLISVGAIALGGATAAAAHTGGFENTPSVKRVSERNIIDDGLNSADARLALTEHSSGRTEHQEKWRTATGRAVARRLGGNDNKLSTRDEAEGTMGGEDYDVSSDQPERDSGSNANTKSDGATSGQRKDAAAGLPERSLDHSDPTAHIHAGAHENGEAEGSRGGDDYDPTASRTDGKGVAPRSTQSSSPRVYRNEGHESPQSHIHAGSENSGVQTGDKADAASGMDSKKSGRYQDEGHESPQSHIHAGPHRNG